MHWDATEVYNDPFFLRKKQGENVQGSSSATITTNNPAPYTLVLNSTPNVKRKYHVPNQYISLLYLIGLLSSPPILQ
jgi:hypothetical protein